MNALDKVEGNLRFWVHNGQIVESLKDLPGVIRKLDEESFNHHVNDEKNDFSNWIKDVFGEAKLANDIQKIKSKSAIVKKISARIKTLKNK